MRRCGLWQGLRAAHAAALLTVITFLFAAAAVHADDLILPNYVGEHATSVAVFVNPLEHGVQFPNATTCTPFGCTVTPGQVLSSGAALRMPMPEPKNHVAGIVHITSPDPALIVYAEIVTGSGALFRVDPLSSRTSAQFWDLQHDGPYNPFIFVGVDAPTVLSYYGTNYQLDKDDAMILPAPGPNIRLVAQLGAHILTFAGINFQRSGSLQIVQAR